MLTTINLDFKGTVQILPKYFMYELKAALTKQKHYILQLTLFHCLQFRILISIANSEIFFFQSL